VEVTHAHEHKAGRRFASLRHSWVHTIINALAVSSSSTATTLSSGYRLSRQRRICWMVTHDHVPFDDVITSSHSAPPHPDHDEYGHDHNYDACQRGTIVDLIVSYVPLLMSR
jgi:hypothetical protein